MKYLAALIGLVCFVSVAWSGSVPFYKELMKNFTKEELSIVDEFMSYPDKPVDAADFTGQFECGDAACNLCASLKLKGQKHEINRYCEHYWGKVGGCLSVYNRAPEVGRTCYKLDINLLFTLVAVDFNCLKHESETITLDTSLLHKAGSGILDVDLFGGKRPQVIVQQKDEENVKLVRTAVKELLAKLE